MRRVPSAVVLAMLGQDNVQLRPTSLRNWTHRGHITRTRDGYDLLEVVRYLDRRRGACLPADQGETLAAQDSAR